MGRPKSTAPTCINNHPRIPENVQVVERCRLCSVENVAKHRRIAKADAAERKSSRAVPQSV